MSAKTRVLAMLAAAVAVAVSGCGGGGSGSGGKPVIGVSISPNGTQSIDIGQQIAFTASVTNDSAAAGVKWSQTGSGTLASSTTTSVTYVAPTSGAAGSAMVTATSVTDPTKTATVTINYTSVPSFTTTTLPSGTEGTPYSAPVAVMGGAGPLTFSLASGTLPAGLSLNPGTGTISGTPTGPNTTSTFTLKVTDSSSGGAQSATSGSLSILIALPAPPVITTTSLPAAQQYTAYTAPIAVTGYGPFTVQVTSGTLPAGVTLTGTATGAQFSGAPQGAQGTSTFTITVTDNSNPTPQVSAPQVLSIVVGGVGCGTGSESLLSGQYAFLLQGFDATGAPEAVVGSFTADGKGGVTSGTWDSNNGPNTVQSNVAITANPTAYTIGADHRGCLALSVGGTTHNYRMMVNELTTANPPVAGGARIIEFDTTGALVAGVLRTQTASAFTTGTGGINGNYAFEMDASKPGGTGGKLGYVGMMTMNGTTIAGSVDTNDSGSIDINSAGYPASPLSIAGSYTSFSATGRGTLMFTASGGGTPDTINAVVYVVAGDEFFLMSSDAQTTHPLVSGSALQQVGTPAQSSLNAASILYIGGTTGTATGSQIDVGIFTGNGAGAFTFSGDENSGGTVKTVTNSGAYTTITTAAASGRITVTNTGDTAPNMLMYYVNANTAFVMSTDNHVLTGFMEPQVGGPFTNGSLNGNLTFGSLEPASAANTISIGPIKFDGAGNVTIESDNNAIGALSLATPVTETYAVSGSGRVVLPETGTTQTIIYIIRSAKAVIFDNLGPTTNPTLVVMEP
jgi:hypothetical protein